MKYLITGCFCLCLVASAPSFSADKIYQSVDEHGNPTFSDSVPALSLIHISEPTRPELVSRMPSSA